MVGTRLEQVYYLNKFDTDLTKKGMLLESDRLKTL
jgi:hypothetical protein